MIIKVWVFYRKHALLRKTIYLRTSWLVEASFVYQRFCRTPATSGVFTKSSTRTGTTPATLLLQTETTQQTHCDTDTDNSISEVINSPAEASHWAHLTSEIINKQAQRRTSNTEHGTQGSPWTLVFLPLCYFVIGFNFPIMSLNKRETPEFHMTWDSWYIQ